MREYSRRLAVRLHAQRLVSSHERLHHLSLHLRPNEVWIDSQKLIQKRRPTHVVLLHRTCAVLPQKLVTSCYISWHPGNLAHRRDHFHRYSRLSQRLVRLLMPRNRSVEHKSCTAHRSCMRVTQILG